MKKKIVLIFAPLLAALILSSCFKDNVDPEANEKNSAITIQDIQFQGLALNNNTTLTGTIHLFFQIDNGTMNADTASLTQYFNVADPNNFSQNYYFDTPEKATKVETTVTFEVKGGGYASNVAISKVTYKRNGTTYLDTPPITINSSDHLLFTKSLPIINF
jgi:hypothetical protein